MSRKTTFRGVETVKPDSHDAAAHLAKKRDHGAEGGILVSPGGGWLNSHAEALYSAGETSGFLVPVYCPVCWRAFDAWAEKERGGWHAEEPNTVGEDRPAKAYCSPFCRARAADAKRRNAPTKWSLCIVCGVGYRNLAPRSAIQQRRLCPAPWNPAQNPVASPADWRQSPCLPEFVARGLLAKADTQNTRRSHREAEGRLALTVRAAMIRGHRPGDTLFDKVWPNLSDTEAWRLYSLVGLWEGHLNECQKASGRCSIERFRLAHRWRASVERASTGADPLIPPALPRRTRAAILAEQEAKHQRKLALAAARVEIQTRRTNALAETERKRQAAKARRH